MRYVVFSPSYLPNEYSLASGNDPDVFAVREGELFVGSNNSHQNYIYGGDSLFRLYAPTVCDERPVHETALLVKENGLVPTRRKGAAAIHQRDWHFYHQLTLLGFPNAVFKPGMKWDSKHCRIKPFGGFTTSYEVAGFSKIGECDTVDVAFSGTIPNLVGMAGLTDQKLNPDASATNEHRGHAWFDLETGILIRQEVEMETLCSSAVPVRRHRRFRCSHRQGVALVLRRKTRLRIIGPHHITDTSSKPSLDGNATLAVSFHFEIAA